MSGSEGKLYIVATPIGNLADLTPRAREILGSADIVAAEDTRHTGKLLQACGIQARLISLHEHNEAERASELLQTLQAGKTVALVSDAGTPLISDPGFRLVREVAKAGIPILPIPGACAAIAALSVAALPSDRFAFEGFLPAKSAARRERLQALAADSHTLIFYETPHRLDECLKDLAEVFGEDRQAAVARELTKAFETTYRGTLGELTRTAQQDENMRRGEIVILVAGTAETESVSEQDAQLERVLKVLLEDLTVKQAADIAAKLTGEPRNRAYKLALTLKSDD